MSSPPTLLTGMARAAVRDAAAIAHLYGTCKTLGGTIGYVHQGGTQALYWAYTDKDNTTPRPVSGLTIEPEERDFEIPRQAAISADGTSAFTGAVSENDEIYWNGDTYVVDRGWDMDALEAVYRLRATKKTIRRVAV